MSKLSDNIHAAQTNERRHVMTPLSSFSVSSQEVPTARCSPMSYVYKVEATFGCSVIIESDKKAVENKLKAVRRQVVEEIFGEFRKDIYSIQRALFEHDTTKALEAVGTLLQNMYEV